jgi:methyl-accepting chemotaxis protein
MLFQVMNHRISIGRNQLIFSLSLGMAGILLAKAGFGIIPVILLLGLLCLLLRFATKPLARFIAHIPCSIHWKFEVAIAIIATVSLFTGLISVGAMNSMHYELHEIQELGPSRPAEVMNAVNELEDTQHGLLITLTPALSMLGVILGATLGAAMAWSVIEPVGAMVGAINRMASRDFSQPLWVANRDELGELADKINQTSEDLVNH